MMVVEIPSSQDQNVIIDDLTAPVFAAPPADVNVNASVMFRDGKSGLDG